MDKEKIVKIVIGRKPVDQDNLLLDIKNFEKNNWFWEISYATYNNGRDDITEINRHYNYKTYKDAMIGALLELDNNQLK